MGGLRYTARNASLNRRMLANPGGEGDRGQRRQDRVPAALPAG